MGITNFKYLLDLLDQKSITEKKDFSAIKHYPLSKLRGKRVAIDFMWFAHTYWSVSHRNEVEESSDLDLLKDVDQEKVFARFAQLSKIQIDRLLGLEITPVFVLDGKPSKEKREHTQSKRKTLKKKKMDKIEKWRKKVEEKGVIIGRKNIQKIRKAMKYSYNLSYKYTSRFSDMVTDLGIPLLKAQGITGEADKLCAFLAKTGLVQGVFTTDRDILVFGAPYIIIGSEYRYNKDTKETERYIKTISRKRIKKGLNVTKKQLIDICVIAGCDYGPKVFGKSIITIYKDIKEYGSIENLPETYNLTKTNYEISRVYFTKKETYEELCVNPIKNLNINFEVLKDLDERLEKYGLEDWKTRLTGFYLALKEYKYTLIQTKKGYKLLKTRNHDKNLSSVNQMVTSNINRVSGSIQEKLKNLTIG